MIAERRYDNEEELKSLFLPVESSNGAFSFSQIGRVGCVFARVCNRLKIITYAKRGKIASI